MMRFILLAGFILNGLMLKAQIKMEKAEGGILFTEKGKNVLFYQAEQKNKEGKLERCNYIHPLWGLDGKILTEDFPADHLHHRGIFWAWHQIWIGEKRIGDGWELKDFEQEVTGLEFAMQKNGSAVLNTEVNWKSELWKTNHLKVAYLNEKTTITIHPRKGNYRKIDFEINLIAKVPNLSIGGSEDVKGYSGFSVRVSLPENVTFIGQKGIIEPKNEVVESNGFINISGDFGANGEKGGLLILDNPSNPGYPQSWILRKKLSMQNAAFPGNTKYLISTEKPLQLKYSVVIYKNKLNNNVVRKLLN